MAKDNLILKLDSLEYRLHRLNNTLDEFQPRLNNTTKVFNAKGKKTSKRVAKLLEQDDLEAVSRQLDDLKCQILLKKTFHLKSKVLATFERSLQQQLDSLQKNKNPKNGEKLKVLKTIEQRFTLHRFAEMIAVSKVTKAVISKLAPTKALKTNPPKWLAESGYVRQFQDKNDFNNPSKIWNETVMSIKGCDKLLSSTMNTAKFKELFDTFDRSLDVLSGKRKEKEAKGANATTGVAEDSLNSIGSESEEEEDKSSNVLAQPRRGQEDVDDEFLEEQILKQYEGMLVASDDEIDEQSDYALDPNVNYNEVTDEERSEEEGESNSESGTEQDDKAANRPPLKVHKAHNLPELMIGYYSGGSDDERDVVDDAVAAEQASNQSKRKNRRGQRARQKIWEQKYGRHANHVQRQAQQEIAERLKKKEEYEQRVAKRQARDRAQQAAQPEGQRGSGGYSKPETSSQPARDAPIHPSWEAKRQAEEKEKNAKFQGKKIVF
ncbi:LAMI_0F09978g1_1 [Lachancea mirantina]|uniref:LAMI_0F09978g1_1 n=1 Tax=Lachancea mirantina TaxID=1230905 RepID=A0A1G4K1I2_9SACH|nr:LAMI_0F09978g1_1 [Lachancea mirantina]